MESLSLYLLGTAIVGALWICWRHVRLLRLHAHEFRADRDEVLLED